MDQSLGDIIANADHHHQVDVAIVGGGICGLATALALHRNGIESVVLERSEALRATGAAIMMHVNGWRALDQLGVASSLRKTAVPIKSGRVISVDNGNQNDIDLGGGEFRCLKRSDLIETMARELPANTVKLGCHVLSVKMDPLTCNPILQLEDSSTVVQAKVVIGCDGVNSVVANDFLGLGGTRKSRLCVVRGFTTYQEEDGHGFDTHFTLLTKGGDLQLGRTPVTHNLVYWFITRKSTSQDSSIWNDPVLIRKSTVDYLTGFPSKDVEMVLKSDLKTLTLTQVKYRAPWELLLPGRGKFHRGTVAVAGDAAHAMAPFLAQGGAASLEDAVALSQCLAKAKVAGWAGRTIEAALDEYVRRRRGRVVRLSAHTYLIGLLLSSSSSSNDSVAVVVKLIIIVVMAIFFRDKAGHTRYDCGRLS